jgi:2-C-methyl-D-erythritol 4-phosphate cytidylyltransferase
VEAAGGEVRVVEAPASNIKVTHAADIARAEALLQESGRC